MLPRGTGASLSAQPGAWAAPGYAKQTGPPRLRSPDASWRRASSVPLSLTNELAIQSFNAHLGQQGALHGRLTMSKLPVVADHVHGRAATPRANTARASNTREFRHVSPRRRSCDRIEWRTPATGSYQNTTLQAAILHGRPPAPRLSAWARVAMPPTRLTARRGTITSGTRSYLARRGTGRDADPRTAHRPRPPRLSFNQDPPHTTLAGVAASPITHSPLQSDTSIAELYGTPSVLALIARVAWPHHSDR